MFENAIETKYLNPFNKRTYNKLVNIFTKFIKCRNSSANLGVIANILIIPPHVYIS